MEIGSSQHVVAPMAPFFVAGMFSSTLASIVFFSGCGLKVESKASKRLLHETMIGELRRKAPAWTGISLLTIFPYYFFPQQQSHSMRDR